MKTKIVFTSCMRKEAFKEPQSQWKNIAKQDPDYLFLLGDQIYMDYGIWPFSNEHNGKPKKYSLEKFKQVMRKKYEAQMSDKYFKPFFEQMHAKNAVFCVWDDHDFAWNGACGNDPEAIEKYGMHEKKEVSRKLFHEYMNCSTNKPEVYCHADVPHARVIFLDNRFYAERPDENKPGQQLLGEDQFRFLEDKLNHNKKLTIICSGITMEEGSENWSNYPDEYARLKSLISRKDRVLFLAGDIHKNKFIEHRNDSKQCFEIISSGLAVNYVGLPLGFDDVHNWGMLEYDDEEILVYLVNKKGKGKAKQYRINIDKWGLESN